MAFSWSGFARTLNDNITKDRDAQREEETWERRLRMQKELEKLYADEVVSRTVLEGDTEVMYNSRGRRIGERILSPEERAEAEAERKKKLADARQSEAAATGAEFGVTIMDDKWALDQEQTRAAIAASRASSQASLMNAETNRRQLDMMAEANAGLPQAVAKELDEVITMINSVPPDGINSAEATTNTLLKSVETAPNAAEARRIIAMVKGQILSRYTRQQAQDRSTRGGFFSGLDDTSALPPPTPGTR